MFRPVLKFYLGTALMFLTVVFFCRENSPELRELENKLRQAYINKELYVQLCERRKHERLREEQVSKPLHYNYSVDLNTRHLPLPNNYSVDLNIRHIKYRRISVTDILVYPIEMLRS